MGLAHKHLLHQHDDTTFGSHHHRIINKQDKKLTYRRESAGQRSLRRSRSFKVTDFGTNWKPVCDFLSVNTNLHPISYRLPDIAQHWSNYRSWRVVPLSDEFFLKKLWEYRHTHIAIN